MSMLEEQIPGVSDLLGEFRSEETAEWPAPLREVPPALFDRAPQMQKADLDRARALELELRAQLDERSAELESQREQVTALKGKVGELEQEIAVANERSARLVGELAQAQASSSLAQGELGVVEEQADSVMLESSRLSAEVEQLEVKLGGAREDLQAETQRAKDLQGEVERLSSVPEPPDKDGAKVEALERLLSACRGANSSNEGEIAGLRFRMQELERSRAEALAVSSDPSESSVGAKTVVEPEAQADGADLKARADELERTVNQLTEREATQQERLEELREHLREEKRRAGALEYVNTYAEEWSGRFEDTEKEAEELRARLIQTEEQLSETKALLESADLERKDSEDALESVIDGLTDEATTADDSIAEPTSDDESEYLRQLEAARRVVQSLEADKQRLGAMIDELTKEALKGVAGPEEKTEG